MISATPSESKTWSPAADKIRSFNLLIRRRELYHCRAVVVAQLAERSLPTPEIHGSNPDIGNISIVKFICQLLSRKDENKEKEAGKGPLKKLYHCATTVLRNFVGMKNDQDPIL